MKSALSLRSPTTSKRTSSPMTEAVIFDIDGTLANCSHRLHHILETRPKDWDAFFGAMDDDLPIRPIVQLFTELETAGNVIILCTGRPENYRQVTERWLWNNGVEFFH